MPNTPGQIGEGITAYFAGPLVSPDDEALAVQLLEPLGAVERLTTERLMDAVTGVSGSGPAYIFLLTEALAAAGEAEGLERELAQRLARQTVIGSAALMAQTGQSPQDLRRAVTSPEGTTAAAMDVLTASSGLVKLMRRAVEAATFRSRQLGK
jgi:pyrroline-5-carboxylate reductase